MAGFSSNSTNLERAARPRRRRGLRIVARALWAFSIALVISVGTSSAQHLGPAGGGHTPATFCHKPGTPAQQELTTDSNGMAHGHFNGHVDVMGPCPAAPVDPDVVVCRGGVTTTVKQSLVQPGDVAGACVDPDVTVCRNGVTTTVKQSQVLGTDAAGACPIIVDSGTPSDGTPGAADTSGAGASQADADPGVDVERPNSPLAVGAQVDDPADGGERVLGVAAGGGAVVPAGAGPAATVTPGTQLPFTGMETNIALGLALAALMLGSLAFRHAGRIERGRAVVAGA